MTKTECSGAMRSRVRKQSKNRRRIFGSRIRKIHTQNTVSRHLVTQCTIRQIKRLMNLPMRWFYYVFNIVQKHTIQNVMRFKVKWKSLGSLHTKDLAQPKMQMNSETFFQGNSMICSGLFQGLKEDQEEKLWGIFLIRLFQLRKSPDLNIRTKYMHRLVTNNCAKYRHHCYQNIIT